MAYEYENGIECIVITNAHWSDLFGKSSSVRMYSMNLEFKAMIDMYKYYLYVYIFPIPYQQTEWELFIYLFFTVIVGGFFFLVFD